MMLSLGQLLIIAQAGAILSWAGGLFCASYLSTKYRDVSLTRASVTRFTSFMVIVTVTWVLDPAFWGGGIRAFAFLASSRIALMHASAWLLGWSAYAGEAILWWLMFVYLFRGEGRAVERLVGMQNTAITHSATRIKELCVGTLLIGATTFGLFGLSFVLIVWMGQSWE